jgi:hypothetical protein
MIASRYIYARILAQTYMDIYMRTCKIHACNNDETVKSKPSLARQALCAVSEVLHALRQFFKSLSFLFLFSLSLFLSLSLP